MYPYQTRFYGRLSYTTIYCDSYFSIDGTKQISLKDTVQKYIRDFLSKSFPITTENLLTHTSGILDYNSINDLSPYIDRWDFKSQFIPDKFKNLPLDFNPGTKYNYSISGYFCDRKLVLNS